MKRIFVRLRKYGPDRELGMLLIDIGRRLTALGQALTFRHCAIGLVRFSWFHPWRRPWRVVRRTRTHVPWVEIGPLDVVFQDTYRKGYDD